MPPAAPVSGTPAFSWQGSVGGVNTGNGNKTTALPLVAWTQRGGLPVACALYHNSQGIAYGGGGAYGYKWIPSYFTYLSPGPGSDVTYTPPYGILDTLTAGGGGTFTLTTPGKVVYSFGFAPGGAGGNAYLSAITDLDGNTLTINHNADTTLSTVVDATGRTLSFFYSGGRLDHVTDPLGRAFAFFYNGAGELTQVNTPPLNGTYYALARLGYDPSGSHNLVSVTGPNGNAATFGYDGGSRLIWARDPLGSQTTFSYGANSTTITDPNGHTLTHTYAAGRLASVTDASGKKESYVYDNNILSSKTDKRGNVWGYSSHFSNGTNTSTSTEPPINGVSASSSVTYDPAQANKPVSSVDALGNTTASTYSNDSHYDLLSVKVTGTGSSPFHGASSTGGYNYGLPTTFADALNYSSSVGYDSDSNVNSATDANNHSSSATYNALGWKLTVTDALNHTTTTTYDNWGRVTASPAPPRCGWGTRSVRGPAATGHPGSRARSTRSGCMGAP